MGRMRCWTTRLVILAAAAVASGCGSAPDEAHTTSAASSTRPGNVDLVSPRPVADHADVVARAGAAAGHVECAGPIHAGGWTLDFGGPAGAADPRAALDLFLDEGAFDLPTSGYEESARGEGRRLFTYAVKGEVKVAAIVGDASHGVELSAPQGWGVETFAACDPAEYAGSEDNELHRDVWTDRDGERIPTTIITSFPGHPHCDWESVTFLHVEGRQYLRDPDDVLGDSTVTAYDGDTTLPADAADAGYRRDGQELWLVPDGTRVFLVTGDRVESWPATTEEVGCR